MKKLALCLIVSALVGPSLAQSIPGITLPATQAQPAASDPLGRDTPSGTVLGFLQVAQNGNYRAAADYLQMSAARRQAQGPELANQLKVLMDRDFEGSLRRLSTRTEGSLEGGGIPDQETIGTFSSGEAEVSVVLVRVAQPNAGKIWLFSQDTLSKVPDLYDNLQAQKIEKALPHALVGPTFLGLPLWQWLALLVAVPAAAGIGWIVVALLSVPRSLWLRFRKRPSLFLFHRVSAPLLLMFGAIAHRVIASYLRLPLLPRLYYYRTIGVVVLVGLFWFVLRATGVTMQRLRTHAISAGRIGTGTLMLLGERLVKAL